MTTGVAGERLDAAVRDAVRDLILVLADSKRLLGMRYAEWLLGAPELEAGIACASMTQDEWGHARILYALLKDFDEDVDRLEHERQADEYRNMEVLDRAPEHWPGLVALNVLADTALTVQLEALRESSHTPLRQRAGKILDEERFHEAHGAAWFRRLSRGGEAAAAALTAATRERLPSVLRWFGPDSERARALRAADTMQAAGSDLRGAYIDRVAPLLDGLEELGDWRTLGDDFDGFDETSRRGSRGGPDEATLVKVRGDKNRAFLMD